MTEEHIHRVIQQAIGTELAYGVNSLARVIDWQSKVRDAIRAEADALKAQRDELLAAIIEAVPRLEPFIFSDDGEYNNDGVIDTIEKFNALIARYKETP